MKLIFTIRNIGLILLMAIIAVAPACNEEEIINAEPEEEVAVSISTTGIKEVLHDVETFLVEVDKPDLVNEIKFYSNDQLIGTIKQAPYEISWNTLEAEDGQYTLKAEAIGFNSSYTGTLGVEVSNNLLTIEVDPEYYTNEEEWFYVASPEGELLSEPFKAENAEVHHIKRPKGYLKNIFQLYVLNAEAGMGEYNSYVYTDFEEKTLYRKINNTERVKFDSYKLNIKQDPNNMEDDFYYSATIGMHQRLFSKSSDYDTGIITADIFLPNNGIEEFYILLRKSWSRWSDGYTYLKVPTVEGQMEYTVNIEDFKVAENSFTLTVEEGKEDEYSSFNFWAVKNGYSYSFPGTGIIGQPFTVHYPQDDFSEFTHTVYWSGVSSTISLQEQGMPKSEVLKRPEEFINDIEVSSLTEFTYNVSKEADVAVCTKVYSEVYNSISQKIYSPCKNGTFKIAPLPSSLLETYPALELYEQLSASYSDFRDYKKINSYAEYLDSILNPEKAGVNYWDKYGGGISQSINRYHGSEGGRKFAK